MKLKSYLYDKLGELILNLFITILVVSILKLFGTNINLIIMIAILLILCESISLMVDFLRKRRFYNALLYNSEMMDKSYLVLDTLSKPEFYEGEMVWKAFLNINKDMAEEVQKYQLESRAYKEYIEMWVHQVKLPLSAMSLSLYNNSSKDKKINVELSRINDYVNQVLYYVRSENAENDYHITGLKLQNVIHETIMDNKNIILDSGVEVRVENVTEMEVRTDRKWLSFILGQLISNSLKYAREEVDSYIRIYTEEMDEKVALCVEDNGIGIPESDIDRVFDKSFTGKNGELRAKSTGMGLYIVRELCNKLGHEISVESQENEFTRFSVLL